jgi:anti-sigma factor RsiW
MTMSRMGDNISRISDDQLDRLVDGELSEPQRREVLSGLDREPEAWRRCALAFLEGQSLRAAMRSMLSTASDQALSSRPTPSSARRPAWLARHATLLATAASFTLALVVSSIVWPILLSSQGTTSPLAQVVSNGQPAPAGTNLAATAQQTVRPNSPWRLVTVSVPDGPQGKPEPIQLPVVEEDAANSAWLRQLPQALPPQVLQALQQSGRRVQQSRQLLPFPLEDGRRLVVPVDQVEIHYVGNREYQ